jgi:hypothetical protein
VLLVDGHAIPRDEGYASGFSPGRRVDDGSGAGYPGMVRIGYGV